jgi:hypothetical protein
MVMEEVLCLGEQQKQGQGVILDWISEDNYQVHGLFDDIIKKVRTTQKRKTLTLNIGVIGVSG